MGWWVLQELDRGVIYLGSWVFWVIFSITLHELAHGWTAIWQGDDVPIHTGHMTWNPIVHMGTWSLVVFALTGIAWGSMPINPSRFRSRYGEAMVALAGPAMNLALGVVAALGFVLWVVFAKGVGEPAYGNVRVFLHAGAWLNVALLIFNLIPLPPLDGWRILADIFPNYNRLWQSEQGRLIAMILFSVMIFRVGGAVFGVVEDGVARKEKVMVSSLRQVLNR